MTKENLDKLWIGIVLGFVGAFAGFLLFGYGFAMVNKTTFSYFYHNIFLGQGFGTSDFQSRIVTFSMLMDIVMFFVFIKKDWYNLSKGLMAVLVISVPVVAWLY